MSSLANNRDDCSAIQFWNVKVVTRKPPTTPPLDSEEPDANTSLEPAYIEEEQIETAVSLKDGQVRMEQQVYRIWT